MSRLGTYLLDLWWFQSGAMLVAGKRYYALPFGWRVRLEVRRAP